MPKLVVKGGPSKIVARKRMSQADILKELGTDSKWNRARKLLSAHCARADKAQSPFEWRAAEFELIKEILAIYGIEP